MTDQITNINSVDDYNKAFGIETRHPLVSIVEMAKAHPVVNLSATETYHYGIYAIFLKQTLCGDITYGRQPYDY